MEASGLPTAKFSKVWLVSLKRYSFTMNKGFCHGTRRYMPGPI